MQYLVIFGTDKIESGNRRKYACIFLLVIFWLGFAACRQNGNKNVSDTVIPKDSLPLADKTLPSLETQYQEPPKSLIQHLKQEAPYVALLNVTTVDSVFNSEKVFSATILKSFKGKLKAGDSLKYIAINDMKYIKHPNDTLIVFLDKAKSPVLTTGGKAVFFFALENASFTGTKYLDSLLTKK